MRPWRTALQCLACVAVVMAGCGGAAPQGVSTPSIAPSSIQTAPAPESARPTPTVTSTTAAFPNEAFAAITEGRVDADLAAELQSILDDLAGEAGVSATVMSAHGTWSGATGKADGVRDLTVTISSRSRARRKQWPLPR